MVKGWRWGDGGACEGKPGKGGKKNITAQMGRTCADTVKLSHFVGSASPILMFRMGQGDVGTQLFSPIKGNICQDHKSSYWTVIY